MARSAQAGVDAAENFGRLLGLGVVTKRESVLVLRLPRAGGARSLACAHGLLLLLYCVVVPGWGSGLRPACLREREEAVGTVV